MPVQRLNHAVLYVRDVAAAVEFYTAVLEFRVVHLLGDQAAFLQAAGSSNDHDLGLFAAGPDAGPSAAGRGTVGLYHLAWEVDTLGELARIAAALRGRGALVGSSDHGTTKALYARDPDGCEFEVCWLVPAADITGPVELRTAPLDLDAEIARYGADCRGGIGVSVPQP